MKLLPQDINQLILQAEKNNDPDNIRNYLSNDLVFRRASGVFVNKEDYLKQMSNTTYSLLKQSLPFSISMSELFVCTISKVEAKGVRSDGAKFNGLYRNVRFFRKEANDWVLYAWRNDEIKNGKIEEPQQFTGNVKREKIEESEPPKEGKRQQVSFEPAARTYWHIHPELQDLSVINGTALVVKHINRGDDEVVQLQVGEQIRIEPGVLHWHGAIENKAMGHIAYNKFPEQGDTTYWFHPVSEEEYFQANRRFFLSST